MKKVLVLGASGNIAPYVTPDLEKDYDLSLSDIVPHPDGKPIIPVDVTSYPDVLEACRGMDAIMNFTVLRDDPVVSFEVSTKGAYHVMKAAAALGIKKVVHTGPQLIRNAYDHEFDMMMRRWHRVSGITGLPSISVWKYARFSREHTISKPSVFSLTVSVRSRQKLSLKAIFHPSQWCGKTCNTPVAWH